MNRDKAFTYAYMVTRKLLDSGSLKIEPTKESADNIADFIERLLTRFEAIDANEVSIKL